MHALRRSLGTSHYIWIVNNPRVIFGINHHASDISGVQHGHQAAVFSSCTEGTSWLNLSNNFDVKVGQLQKLYEIRFATPADRQPKDPMDIEIPVVSRGLPLSLNPEEEKLVVDAILFCNE
eukprot:IDg10703t1